MSIFNKLFSPKTTVKSTEHYSMPSTSPPSPRTGYFLFNADAPLFEGDSPYRKATFYVEEDGSGTVYYDFTHARVKIGSFRTDPGTNRVVALRESDGEEIAFVDSSDGYLYLSRAGMHNASLKSGWYEPFPDPLFVEIGRCMGDNFKGVFYRNGILGSYQGNRSAASAALACIIYELHTNGWHEFFNYI